jgi:hypothetical protein
MATVADWKPGYTERAQEVWAEYQRTHDVADQKGRAAGVDPVSGRVWIGDDAEDIHAQLQTEKLDIPLYFVRIGYDYYYRKGGRR